MTFPQNRSPEQQSRSGCVCRRAPLGQGQCLAAKRPSTFASARALTAQGYGF
jgi:hypothetical protein